MVDLNDGKRCRHGRNFTSPVPCGECISERKGAWRDYGGYGYPYTPDDPEGKPIRCEMCNKEIDEAGVRAMEKLALTRNMKWLAISPAGPEQEPEHRVFQGFAQQLLPAALDGFDNPVVAVLASTAGHLCLTQALVVCAQTLQALQRDIALHGSIHRLRDSFSTSGE